MDAVTHVLAGYGLGIGLAWTAARVRRGATGRQWAAVAGAAALAPDLDVLFLPLTAIDRLYFLQHRGATHSLLGAPAMAGLVLAGLSLAGRRWQRFAVFRWRRGLVVPLLLGAWSHLLLDVITHQGAPLVWPWTERRQSLEVFYWIIWWLAPVSLVPLVLRFRGRWDDRRVLQAAAVVAVLIVVVGAVRLAAKPEGGHVYATRHPLEWAVATEHGNGTWRVDLVQGSRVESTWWYEPMRPDGAEAAVERVLATDAYRGFRFGSTAPHVVQAEALAGGWNVTVVDIVQRSDAEAGPDWLPGSWRDDAGLFEASVVDGRVNVHSRWPR